MPYFFGCILQRSVDSIPITCKKTTLQINLWVADDGTVQSQNKLSARLYSTPLVQLVLRRLFELMRKAMTGNWTDLYNEKPDNLFSSLNPMIMKSRRMKWMGHVACMQEMRNVH
jgi:hypothetical protein